MLKEFIVEQDEKHYMRINEHIAVKIGAMFGFDTIYYRLNYRPEDGIKKIGCGSAFHLFEGADSGKADFFVLIDLLIDKKEKIEFLSEKIKINTNLINCNKSILMIDGDLYLLVDDKLAPMLYYFLPDFYSTLLVKSAYRGFEPIIASNSKEFIEAFVKNDVDVYVKVEV